MAVSATLEGELVTIVEIQGEGSSVIVSYVNSSSELRVKKLGWPMGGNNTNDKSLYIASAATVV